MNQSNTLYLRRYLASFLIATFLFILIFAVAHSFAYVIYERNARESEVIQKYISDLDNDLRNQSCSDHLMFDASSKLDNVGNRIDLLEKRMGKSDPRVVAQKKQYGELEYAHFRIVQRLNKDCGARFITLLYFYTQAKEESDANEQTAYILNAFKAEDSDRIMIYSFDASLDSGLIKNIRAWYNVTTTPLVVVNEKDSLTLRNIKQLDVYFPVSNKD